MFNDSACYSNYYHTHLIFIGLNNSGHLVTEQMANKIYNVHVTYMWHVCITTDAVKMQQYIPCVLLSYMSVTQQHFHGKLMSPATIKCKKVFK
jgi:hypothetical protein